MGRVRLVSGNASLEAFGANSMCQRHGRTRRKVAALNKRYQPPRNISGIPEHCTEAQRRGMICAEHPNGLKLGLVFYGLYGPRPAREIFGHLGRFLMPDESLLERDGIAYTTYQRLRAEARPPIVYPRWEGGTSHIQYCIKKPTSDERGWSIGFQSSKRRAAYDLIAAVSDGTWDGTAKLRTVSELMKPYHPPAHGYRFLEVVWEDAAIALQRAVEKAGWDPTP